ncbi:DUF4440 domain-containing protein [Rufibacter sp. LB8]|uniref:YybH family protein n=1 Tax=Rufibacter sp. LB8 TaxID=2777781 RepID=UPI00178C56E3|nr:nuclear transport factor 2 family protein [Rufibacter sp. LB8]
MKSNFYRIVFVFFLFASGNPLFAQSTDSREAEEVKKVLRAYKEAVEALDGTKATALFAANSQVYESGGVEGTYAHYLEHHLGPEFKAFKSFKYSDYKPEVTVDGNYAFATETYVYTLVLAKDGSTIKKKGVATSTLKKVNGKWQILITHSSSRNTK